ncbi:MAG: major capsid protein [Arizlama microvirus]|nr:MAG: major capsid protein [Arizlama microvirus]
MNPIFKMVENNRPKRSMFNLSYEKKFSCDMGQLIPVMCDEVIPGDVISLGSSMIIRFQPLVAPVLHEVDVYVHSFFVPYRLLWEDWESFITGGPLGTDAPTLPRWDPSTNNEVALGSLWDYLGFPILAAAPSAATLSLPMDFPRRAYAFIFNEYYRDETLQAEVDYDPIDPLIPIEVPYVRNWEKDYFTSSLLWQQRGVSPAFPISGSSSAVFPAASFNNGAYDLPIGVLSTADNRLITAGAQGALNLETIFNNNTVSLSSANPIDIADIRLGFQIQRWLERNARSGARYTSFLKAHFGVSPTDERLDRPEYIGGMKAPVLFSEVLQTSETGTTPQGNLAGHGLSVSAVHQSNYRVQEFGLIMSIMSIMPKPSYQQGINRQWLRQTKLDFFFPEFAHLSEQEIKQGEIYWTDDEADNQIPFGFCGAYDEMRVKQSMVCGDFRTVYDYWHIGRQFGSAPVLDEAFIQCIPRKDIFAAPSEPGCLVQYGNIIKALRPMPIIAEPGMLDHG